MKFGEVLKNLLEEKGLTQSELAGEIGYTQRAISKWVNLQAEPTESAIRKVAEYFGVSLDYLLGRTDELGVVVMPGSELTPEERELLRDFRGLSRPLKDMLRSIIRTWQGEDRIPAKKPNGSSTGAG